MVDWNWFFSSVAQSIAALVGIIAAFTITSIVSNQSEFTRKLARSRELLARGQELLDKLNARYFGWYNKRQLESALDSVEYSAKSANGPSDPQSMYDRYTFPPFVPREEVLKKIAARVAWAKRPPEPPRQTPYGFALPEYAGTQDIMKANLQPQLAAERELIEAVIIEVRHHSRLVAQMLSDMKANPEDSPIVRLSLVGALLLFYLGVIYPLSFLPLRVGSVPELSVSGVLPLIFSLRGAILLTPTVLFSVLCLALLRVSASLRCSPAVIADLEAFSKPELYSPYLQIMIRNQEREHQGKERCASCCRGRHLTFRCSRLRPSV